MTKVFRLCLITICISGISELNPAGAMQTLADAARREAERREALKKQGIKEKVIEENGKRSSGEGNVSLFTPSKNRPEESVRSSSDSKKQSSLRRYRTKLNQLDRKIRKGEVRLENLQDRLETLKRKSYKVGNFKELSRNQDSQDRVLEQVDELRIDLKLLRKERRELYDSGRREGYLPGELEGKGIIP